MPSKKHVGFRKRENFVKIKCFPEDISKDKGKKTNFRKHCRNFEIVHGHHQTYKWKRKVTCDIDRKHLMKCLN